MLVHVESELACSADKAWSLVLKPSTLLYVASPLAHIVPAERLFPVEWASGETYFCRSYLFGIFPVGKREIYMERVDSKMRQLQTRESDPLIQKWDHLIAITELDHERCLYSDTVEIEAGMMTYFVWIWANWFYRYRQYRWHKMLKVQDLWNRSARI